jgi:serine/threonine protein kinase/tetratricopeptide (TPR) repeat protein
LLREVFNRALEKESPGERAAYLDEACGQDSALRSRVERLLRAHDRAGGFLGGVRGECSLTGQAVIDERPGARIGPYKLLEQIGEGGFGVVFLAEQERPVRRRVALKIIKPGMDTREVIARFEAERQALALMDHACIAKVHDAGATANGRPYFVMELVQGVPIIDYCDQCHLTIRERLELFVLVCQAVQHAHQKGVIHRDIKPTNVLVAMPDGRPAPKIIDFGVAKAINQRLTEQTLVTGFAQIVGTPLYMSPEQAELSPLGVDTRTDIYSLGMMLYELLTGTTPFERDRLHAASYDELCRIIREEEPPRPSARISTLSADVASTVAGHRRTDPRRLRQAVRGDLDWIVMKAVEKDRNRRYESANSLARDVERYLQGDAVDACPPSVTYRLSKVLRRHKPALLTALIVAVALVTGTVVSTWQAIRANQAEALASRRAEAERRAHQASDAARQEAETHLATARQAVDRLLTRVAEQRLLHVPQMELLRRQLLEDALEFYRGFLTLRRDDPDIRKGTGSAYLRYGTICHLLGRFEEADEIFHEAIAILEQNPPGKTPDLELLQAYVALAENLLSLDRYEEAETLLRRGIDMAEAGARANPGNDRYRYWRVRLGWMLVSTLSQRYPREAATLARQLIETDRDGLDRRQLATAYGQLGRLELQSGQFTEAAATCSHAIAQLEALSSESPESNSYRSLLAAHLLVRGKALAEAKEWEAAEQDFRRAMALADRVYADSPDARISGQAAATIRTNFARKLMALNRHAEAESLLREALAIHEAIRGQQPSADGGELPVSPDWQLLSPSVTELDTDDASPIDHFFFHRYEIGTRVCLAEVLGAAGRQDEADALFREVADSQLELETELGHDPQFRLGLANLHAAGAGGLVRAGRFVEAEQCSRLALHGYAILLGDSPHRAEFRDRLASEHYRLGRILSALDRIAEAVPMFRSAAEHYRQLAGKDMHREAYRSAQAASLNAAAWLLATAEAETLRDPDLAVELARQSVELVDSKAEHWNTLGIAQYRAGDFAAALEALERSMALGNGGNGCDWFFLSMTHWKLGEQDEARRWYQAAIEWMDTHAPEDRELQRFRAEAQELNITDQ